MKKNHSKNIIKILILSTIIVVVGNIGGQLLNANLEKTSYSTTTKNIHLFTAVDQGKSLITSVAIGTSISTQSSGQKLAGEDLIKQTFSATQLMNLSESQKQDLIAYNMQLSEEYKNILNSDIPGLIRGTNDKKATIDAIIDQLEFRYVSAREQVSILTRQKESLTSDMNNINTQIENLKIKIDTDFGNNDAEASTENIETYLELKREYYFARTYIIYINHFLGRYNVLNTYNLALADTIQNNMDALIKDSYVVIPDSGTYFLDTFELLLPEE